MPQSQSFWLKRIVKRIFSLIFRLSSRVKGRQYAARLKTDSLPSVHRDNLVHQQAVGDRNVLLGSITNSNVTVNYESSSQKAKSIGIYQVPTLPADYVSRPELVTEIRKYLIQKTEHQTLLVSALHGLGGIGKTVLATAVAYEREIREYFSDGILWVTLGQEPELLELLSQWIQALGDSSFRTTSIEAASSQLRLLLQDKKILLILDDVWESDHAELFRVGGVGCRVLMATREAVIREAESFDIDVMTSTQSISLLQNALNRTFDESERVRSLALAEVVGYLPLALKLVAANINNGISWEELLSDISTEVLRLERLDEPVKSLTGSGSIKRRNFSLIASLNLSLKRLSLEKLVQFIWLGVLPEDTLITESMAKTLWQIPTREARNVLLLLKHKSLVIPAGLQNSGKPGYRLHDVVRYSAQRLIERPTEIIQSDGLIGLGLTIAAAHSILLDRYKSQTTTGQWYTLPNDGYIHSQLVWHLNQAGRISEIHELFQEVTLDGRNGWYSACRDVGQPTSFASDLSTAWNLAKSDREKPISECIILQMRYALITTTLNTLFRVIPSKWIRVQLDKGHWTLSQAISYIHQIQDKDKATEMLVELIPVMPSSHTVEFSKIVQEILESASMSEQLLSLSESFLQSQWTNVIALTEEYLYGQRQIDAWCLLSQYLPDDHWPLLLALAEEVYDPDEQVKLVFEISKYCPTPYWLHVVELIESIDDEINQAAWIYGVVDNIPTSFLHRLLDLFDQMQESVSRLVVASALLSRIPNLPIQLVDIVQQIDKNRLSAAYQMATMASYLPDDMLSNVLSSTEDFSNDEDRADAIWLLSRNLPDSLFPEALEFIRKIQDEAARSRALGYIARYLPESLFSKVLIVIKEINDERSRSYALNRIIALLPEELMSQAIAMAERIGARGFQGLYLAAVIEQVPRFSDEVKLWSEGIQDDYYSAAALHFLSVYIPELVPQALEAIGNISDEDIRTECLSAVAQETDATIKLSVEHATQVLDILEKFKTKKSWRRVFEDLAQHFPGKVLPRAMSLAEGVEDAHERVVALSSLAEYFPEAVDKVVGSIGEVNLVSGRYYNYSIVEVLRRISKYMTPALWSGELLTSISSTSDSNYAEILHSFAEQSPEVFLFTVLRLIEKIPNESARMYALSGLCSRLPNFLIFPVLSRISQIEDEDFKRKAIVGLAKHIPQALLPQLLDIIKQLSSRSAQTWTLIGVLKRLTFPLSKKQLMVVSDCLNKAIYESNNPCELEELLLFIKLDSSDFHTWQKIIEYFSIHSYDRKDFIRSVSRLVPSMRNMSNEETLVESATVLREVCEQWP